jgi:hypothetical protein
VSGVLAKLRQVPPIAWPAGVALVGLLYLIWHRYATDDADTDWTTPKETQPGSMPLQLGTEFPAGHGGGRPMGDSAPFRGRSWPATLFDSHTSIIGEV